MKPEKITEDTEVSTSELACVLGVTGRRIRQMAEDGLLERVREGRFCLVDSIQKYIASIPKRATNEEDAKIIRTRLVADAQLKAAKATVAIMEAEELKNNMHRAEDVEALTEDLIYTIRSALVALPDRLAVDAAKATTAAEASEVIRKEVKVVMRELAGYHYDPKKHEERARERMSWGGVDDDND